MHIYNGATAKEKIDQLLSQNPLSHRQHIFVLLDLDNFKLINKTFGIAISPKDGNNFSELSKKADVALYEVKRNTKKGYKVYDASNEWMHHFYTLQLI